MGDPYRDSKDSLRVRVADLGREVKAREARLTESFWRFLPPARAQSLRELAARGLEEAGEADYDALARLEDALSRYLAALDEAIALAPSLEKACRTVPATALGAPPRPRCGILSLGFADDICELWEQACEQLSSALRGLGVNEHLEQQSEFATSIGFRFEETPFNLTFYFGGKLDALNTKNEHVLVTSVAPATPRLELAPELMRHWFLRSLRLIRDLQIDDAAFDGSFLIDADDLEGARAVLTEEVRAALLVLTNFDIPALVVEDGRATLSWSCDPCLRALRAAAHALAAIRRVPLNVKLLND